jgi:hypothetical protein
MGLGRNAIDFKKNCLSQRRGERKEERGGVGFAGKTENRFARASQGKIYFQPAAVKGLN